MYNIQYIYTHICTIMNYYEYVYIYTNMHKHIHTYIYIYTHTRTTYMDGCMSKSVQLSQEISSNHPKNQQEGQDQLGAGDEIKFATSNESKAAETSPTFRILHNSPIKYIM